MKKNRAATLAATALLSTVGLAACSTKADTVNHNLDKDAESFKIARHITFINGITDKAMLEITGFCSIDYGTKKIDVTCKVDGKYLRHTLTKSDNSFAVSEQLYGAAVSDTHYKFVIRPGTVIPDLDVQGSSDGEN